MIFLLWLNVFFHFVVSYKAKEPQPLSNTNQAESRNGRNLVPNSSSTTQTTASLAGRQVEIGAPSQWAIDDGLAIGASLNFTSPHFQHQWHLHNVVEIGHDLNVSGVWAQGITGKNATVCVIDDGLNLYHDDLRENFLLAGSWDLVDSGPDPQSSADELHGTRSAGTISASRNGVCGVGVAFDSKVSGIRIPSNFQSDSKEAVSFTYEFQKNHIFAATWGTKHDGMSLRRPALLAQRALVDGVQRGRSGLGTIYVFPTGDGGENDDNCNFDGYSNSIYSSTVGAIDRKDDIPPYAEKCAAQLAVSYSSGFGGGINTMDNGRIQCTSEHGGTAAASALVAGVYALLLEVNPKLTWRDIQWLTVLTAVELQTDRSDYQENKALGKSFSHLSGYGKINAYAMVEAAKSWVSVQPQAWYMSSRLDVTREIPQDFRAIISTIEITKENLKTANLARLEHVTVTIDIEHSRRGDVSVEIYSPSGMISYMAHNRRNDNSSSGLPNWTFMSVAHWGESGIGTWTILVRDMEHNEHRGIFKAWKLGLWGESLHGWKQPLMPLPSDHRGNEEDKEEAFVQIIEMTPQSTSLLPNPLQSLRLSTVAQVLIYAVLLVMILFLIGLASLTFHLYLKKNPSIYEVLPQDADETGLLRRSSDREDEVEMDSLTSAAFQKH